MEDAPTNKQQKKPTTTPDPFQRFEDFTRKLVNVPKEEIDHAETNYERRKKRRQAKNNN